MFKSLSLVQLDALQLHDVYVKWSLLDRQCAPNCAQDVLLEEILLGYFMNSSKNELDLLFWSLNGKINIFDLATIETYHITYKLMQSLTKALNFIDCSITEIDQSILAGNHV